MTNKTLTTNPAAITRLLTKAGVAGIYTQSHIPPNMGGDFAVCAKGTTTAVVAKRQMDAATKALMDAGYSIITTTDYMLTASAVAPWVTDENMSRAIHGGRKLYFPLADVAILLTAVLNADDHTDSWIDAEDGRKTGPALMWVKDDGVYLMSNAKRDGELPDIVRARADSPTGPVLDGDQWDLTRDICGGDDFAEYLTVGPDADNNMADIIRLGHRDNLRWFVIEVMGESIGIGVE